MDYLSIGLLALAYVSCTFTGFVIGYEMCKGKMEKDLMQLMDQNIRLSNMLKGEYEKEVPRR